MATAVTMVWRVQFMRDSLNDSTLYYIDLASSLHRDVADKIAAELKRQGYVEILVKLVVTFP